MQIPILNGIYADAAPDFRTSYPKNLVPVPKQTGISAGYLRPADGVVEAGTGPGVGRGGINWNGVLYRVMGTKLVSIAENNTVTEIGDVGGTDRVTFDYGFTYLAIASNNNLFLYDGTTLTQVTDPDLGVVLDVVWVDGYYMTTDGEFLVITDLADPFAVNPLKYGSSEADPDPINALLKLRNEVYALNRNTIEVFDNVGTTGFPFQRIAGAQIQKGAVGTHACCVFMDNIAFMGGGRNEAPSIFMGANGSTQKIATREIEQILATYTETQLASAFLEERIDKAHQFLIIHLPNHTLVFDGASTQAMGQPIWFTLSSTLTGDSQWKAQSVIWVYDKWQVYNPTNTQFGYLDDTISSHWGVEIGWEFGTQIVYNESNGAIFHQLELIALTGHVAADTSPTIWAQHSSDGETWSVEKPVRAGTLGQRAKRLVWLQQGYMNNWRIQRFRGTSEAHISISRLEARLEPLAF
jgi:hypothetical protein